jgi:hypothetical protein
MRNTIKKETDIFKKDLSKVEGSYTKCISDNINLIYDLGVDTKVDLVTFVNKIIDIIKDAKDTDAKRNFLVKLKMQRSKMHALEFVNNAYLRGCGLEAI